MASSNAGAGSSPLGVGAYGYGTPATAPTPGGAVNRLASGKQTGSPNLSLGLDDRGQYVFDEFGRRTGTTDVRHLVILALRTVRGSSCLPNLGQRLDEIDKINDTTEEEIKQRIEEALSAIVARGLVSVTAINVDLRQGHPTVSRVTMIDLSTQTQIDLSI